MTPANMLGMMGGNPAGGNPNSSVTPNSAQESAPTQAPNTSSPSDDVMGMAGGVLNIFEQFSSQFPGVAEAEKAGVVQALGRYIEKIVGRMSQASQTPSGIPQMGSGESNTSSAGY